METKAECECAPAYEGLSLFSSWNLTSSLKIPLQKEKQAVKFFFPPTALYIMRDVRLKQNLEQKLEMSE